MPTYEYVCRDCGEQLEVVQSFRDDALEICPVCAGPLRKVFGNIGLVFKGSGFYKTDSRSTSSTTVSGENGKSSASSESSGSKSPESKPSESKPSESKTSDVSKAAAPTSSAAS
jgi:putative FmdB family regulatory protein